MRPDRDLYYLGIAKAEAQRSPCLRRRFGAIIVVNDVIVSTGYNGPARGVINCDEVGCAKDLLNVPSYTGYDVCPAVHAEENAVVNAARHGSRVFGGTLYIYGEKPDGSPTPSYPCDRCKRVLINAGVKEVVTLTEDRKIIRYKVADWIEDDSKKYVQLLEKIKKEQSS